MTRHLVIGILIWTLIVGISLLWNVKREYDQYRHLAIKEAQSNYNKDISFRIWGSSHGGVYVPVTDRTPPNPALAHIPERDITTPSGRQLTLMNPAYMLRQIMEDYSSSYGIRGKITSNKLLNPNNAPDAWENAALQSFEKGSKEVLEFTTLDGKPFLRLMKPLYIEKSCLKCHDNQAYKIGDVRGGVGVSVPLDMYDNLRNKSVLTLLLSHFLFLVLGVGGMWLFNKRDLQRKAEALLAEEAIRRSEEKYRSIISTTAEGFWLLSVHDHKITEVNLAICEILKYKPEEMIGRSPAEFAKPEYRQTMSNIISRTKITNRRDFNGILLSKEGNEIHVHIQCTTIYNEDRKPEIAFAFITNINTQKELEDKLRSTNDTLITMNLDLEKRVFERTRKLEDSLASLKKLQNELIETGKMAALGGLVAGVAHEINTPIGIGITAASLLMDRTSKAMNDYHSGLLNGTAMDDYFQVANESSRMIFSNLTRTAELVKSFKQVAVDQVSQDRRVVHLHEYIEEFLLSLLPYTKKSRHVIKVECPADIQFDSYPGALAQIITNLIINSLVHGFEEIEFGSINLSISEENARIRIHYFDNGKGIDPDILKVLFHPFTTTKRGRGGFGLGMHIVYNLVTQSLGGSIRCESIPGNGVNFFIELPNPTPITSGFVI
ncbi:MAG: DUF3365 domain-containing protein [Magnetococcales bacterium]|nr:DUF3365 domain-containing protein [Magnetococcales bacterium]